MHSVLPRHAARRLPPGFWWSAFQHVSTVLILLLVLATAGYVAINVYLNFIPNMVAAAVTPWQIVNKSLLGLHIVTAFPPLLVGFYLFFPESRKGGNRTHRWLGTVYCAAIWISAVAGLILAAANSRGIVAQTGFGTLAVIWFSTTLFAYRTAREKDFIAHREWMIRSYAITLAVVTVRPLFLFGPPSGIDADTWYAMVTWLCWLPNLLIAEIYVRSTNVTGRLAIGRGRRRGADGEPRSARPATANGAAS